MRWTIIILAIRFGLALGIAAVPYEQAGSRMQRDEGAHAAVERVLGALDQGRVESAHQTGRGEGPMRIIYALDTSSGMREGNKIGKAKEALTKALGELRPSDSFNIIVFNSNVTAFRNEPVSATPANLTNARKFINAIRVGEGTNMAAAMDLAFSMPEITHLYLMAGSEPNSGLIEYGALRRYILEKNTSGVRIMTLALGLGENFASMGLLKGIAEDNHGTYGYINLSKIASPSVNHPAEVAKAGRSTELLDLRTASLASPLTIPGDPLKRSVTSLEIRGELGGDSDGKGTVTLDESTITFNEFGDSTKLKSRVSEPCQVAFRQIKQVAKNEQRRLYEIVFADGSFPKRMFLMVSDGTIASHRLLIYGGNEVSADSTRQPVQILDLQGLPEIKERLPDAPFRSTFSLTTLTSYPGASEDRLRRICVRGIVNGPVAIDLDPNYFQFDVFGDIVITTLMGSIPIKATLKRIEIPDPARKGRLLFEIQTGDPRFRGRCSLVLSPTDAGPHRLLIREADNLRYVLPLHDPMRSYHLTLQPQLDETPLQERQAVADLQQRIGYTFRYKIQAQRVVELSVLSDADADRIGPALKHLKNLRSLELNGPRLNTPGIASLHGLTNLQYLRFSGGHIQDQVLASVKGLTQLRELWFYDCQGITDRGMIHLAGLKGLKSLWLYREDSLDKPNSPVALVTDAGLAHLKGLKELEQLNLMGQKITDAGLKCLEDLTNLKELFLSGEGITDAGLKHLKGLSHLKSLHLNQTQVTPAGKAALKSRLPGLTIDG